MVGNSASKPLYTNVLVNGKDLVMEIDTGVAVSLISETQCKQLFPNVKLDKLSIQPRTYTGEKLPVLGQINVRAQYEGQTKSLDLVVVTGNGPTLLGRNWLLQLRLDWAAIRKVEPNTQPLGLEPLLAKHSKLFADELGTISPFKTKLRVQPGVAPKFCKPRSVPYATKQAVKDELDRLESSGILDKVSYSEWAAPIVVVPKKDGKIRLCGDYKVTVNSALEVDQYPLPRPDDLFATLAGGTKFTTLDLSQAYLQLVLDEDSASYVTVNTHRGLYRYTRLPFGIASAPAMFQKVMDTILQDIPNVICYIDDILVTGADDQAHLRNLAEVFARLERHGIRMKKGKCHFMRNSVQYLGHGVDATGLYALPDKLEAIQNAPKPTNVQELCSFLGLLN